MQLEPLQVLTYKQPTIRGVEGVVVTLKRWPNECWRYVYGQPQAGSGSLSEADARKVFTEFVAFEEKIGSELL